MMFRGCLGLGLAIILVGYVGLRYLDSKLRPTESPEATTQKLFSELRTQVQTSGFSGEERAKIDTRLRALESVPLDAAKTKSWLVSKPAETGILAGLARAISDKLYDTNPRLRGVEVEKRTPVYAGLWALPKMVAGLEALLARTHLPEEKAHYLRQLMSSVGRAVCEGTIEKSHLDKIAGAIPGDARSGRKLGSQVIIKLKGQKRRKEEPYLVEGVEHFGSELPIRIDKDVLTEDETLEHLTRRFQHELRLSGTYPGEYKLDPTAGVLAVLDALERGTPVKADACAVRTGNMARHAFAEERDLSAQTGGQLLMGALVGAVTSGAVALLQSGIETADFKPADKTRLKERIQKLDEQREDGAIPEATASGIAMDLLTSPAFTTATVLTIKERYVAESGAAAERKTEMNAEVERYAQALLDEKINWGAAESVWKPVLDTVPAAGPDAPPDHDFTWGFPCDDEDTQPTKKHKKKKRARHKDDDCGERYYRLKPTVSDAELEKLMGGLKASSDDASAAAPSAPVDVAGAMLQEVDDRLAGKPRKLGGRGVVGSAVEHVLGNPETLSTGVGAYLRATTESTTGPAYDAITYSGLTKEDARKLEAPLGALASRLQHGDLDRKQFKPAMERVVASPAFPTANVLALRELYLSGGIVDEKERNSAAVEFDRYAAGLLSGKITWSEEQDTWKPALQPIPADKLPQILSRGPREIGLGGAIVPCGEASCFFRKYLDAGELRTLVASMKRASDAAAVPAVPTRGDLIAEPLKELNAIVAALPPAPPAENTEDVAGAH